MQQPSLMLLAQAADPDSSHKETSDKPKLRTFVHNNWPKIFKSIKVMKVKDLFQLEGN